MVSNDVYLVVNNEQSFRLYMVEQFGKIESRMEKLESRMDGLESRMDKLESRMTVLEHQQEITNSRLDMGIWFAGLCFGVLALVIAFVGLFAPKFWEHMTRRDSRPQTQPNISELAEEVIAVIKSRYELKPKRSD